MDYVEGTSLAELWRLASVDDRRARARLAVRVVLDACAGLEAAHELRGDDGEALDLVHRDVSPHNVLVGIDGIARLTDFGIAKSAAHTGAGTATGGLKGKLGYMAPEYVESSKADRRADVFALGVVLWESLTGSRLFQAATEVELIRTVVRCEVVAPSSAGADVPSELDQVVLRALARDPDERFSTAAAFSEALEAAARAADLVARPAEVGALVAAAAEDVLSARRRAVAADATPSEGSGAFDYVGHDRTATLDPTVQGASPSHAPPASPDTSAASASPTSRARVVAIAALAAVAIAIVVGVVSRADPPPAAAHDDVVATRAPTPSASAAPASAPIESSTAALPQPSPVPSTASGRRVVPPPPVAPRRAPPLQPAPASVAPAAPSPASPPATASHRAAETEPTPPDRAPPNPYR
jgi:serine/threonine-protein kinase